MEKEKKAEKKRYNARISEQRMSFVRNAIYEEYDIPDELMYNVVCEYLYCV